MTARTVSPADLALIESAAAVAARVLAQGPWPWEDVFQECLVCGLREVERWRLQEGWRPDNPQRYLIRAMVHWCSKVFARERGSPRLSRQDRQLMEQYRRLVVEAGVTGLRDAAARLCVSQRQLERVLEGPARLSLEQTLGDGSDALQVADQLAGRDQVEAQVLERRRGATVTHVAGAAGTAWSANAGPEAPDAVLERLLHQLWSPLRAVLVLRYGLACAGRRGGRRRGGLCQRPGVHLHSSSELREHLRGLSLREIEERIVESEEALASLEGGELALGWLRRAAGAPAARAGRREVRDG